jgi:hypothetical protein
VLALLKPLLKFAQLSPVAANPLTESVGIGQVDELLLKVVLDNGLSVAMGAV